MAEWLSSWLAEQEVRGSIPGLATWISEIGYLLLPSRDMAGIPLKRRKSSIQPTNQPTSGNNTDSKYAEEHETWAYIYYSKEVWNQLRVFLCIIHFKLLQTLKGFTDQGTIFRGCFLHDHLYFLWKAIRSKWHNFNCSKITFLTQKMQNFIYSMFNQYLYYQCLKFYKNRCNSSCFIMFYTAIPTPKTGKSAKVVTFEKSMLYPPVHKITFITIMQSIW